MFQTDQAGGFNMAFPLPPLMPPIDIRLQAGIVGPGPLGNLQLTNGIQVARPCPPCTLTRARWASPVGADFILFDQNWLAVFPFGMDIGIFNPGNGNNFPNGFHWTGNVTGKNALKTFLQTLDGLPSALVADAVNPTNSMGSGGFARLTAVLQLNIAFNAAGLLGSPTPGFGAFVYNNPFNPLDALNGFTVSQILVVCNNVLSGAGPIPPGYGPGNLSNLLEDLQSAFDDCKPSDWADSHLHAP
jgi:hypothetical protein